MFAEDTSLIKRSQSRTSVDRFDAYGTVSDYPRPMNERVTPDGRYFVVRGRLWRRTNPNLPIEKREAIRSELMAARRAVKAAQASGKPEELALARNAVDKAKIALGERGPVWWTDGAPDLNRHKVSVSPYAEWWTTNK